MPNYEKMYFELAACVADAIELLIKAQQKGEEGYINTAENCENRPEHLTKGTQRPYNKAEDMEK
jgi:hypothetical protein